MKSEKPVTINITSKDHYHTPSFNDGDVILVNENRFSQSFVKNKRTVARLARKVFEIHSVVNSVSRNNYGFTLNMSKIKFFK